MQRLREHHDVRLLLDGQGALEAGIADLDVLVFRSGVSVSATMLERAPDLRLIVRAGSGLDNIDMGAVGRRGITFERIPGPGAQAVAELTFAFMLALSRRLLQADRSMREGRWAKHNLQGSLLQGKTIGIVGLGSIGMRVATLATAWDLPVIGCVAHPSTERTRDLAAQGVRVAPFADVLAAAEHLCVHVPKTGSTIGLIDATAIARMRPGSTVINLSRGGVVDERALADALASGHLAGAAMDVHANEGADVRSPLHDLPNVILTPHIGSMAVEAQRQIGERVVQIIETYAEQPMGVR